MRQPKPIRVTLGVGDVTHQLELNMRGFRTNSVPYLTADCFTNGNVVAGGFIKDRDLWRLKKWTDACLSAKRKNKR